MATVTSDSLIIPEIQQLKYSDTWAEMLQQKTNRLAQFVQMQPNCTGRAVKIHQIESMDVEEKTSRYENLAAEDVDVKARFIVPRTFHRKIQFDEQDAERLYQTGTPVSESARELYKAAQRKMEEIIIDGLNGNNTTASDAGDDATETTAFDTTNNLVAVNYVETGTTAQSNMTLGKMRRALEILTENEAWGQDAEADGDVAVLALSASQINALLRTDEVINSDYNRRALAPLQSGQVTDFLGFRIIRTQQLPIDANNVRSCLAWVKSCTRFGVWNNQQSRLWVDNENGATKYRILFEAGACRMEEKGVVRINCDEDL